MLTGRSRNHLSHQLCVCFAESAVKVSDQRRPLNFAGSQRVSGIKETPGGVKKTVAVAMMRNAENVFLQNIYMNWFTVSSHDRLFIFIFVYILFE